MKPIGQMCSQSQRESQTLFASRNGNGTENLLQADGLMKSKHELRNHNIDRG